MVHKHSVHYHPAISGCSFKVCFYKIFENGLIDMLRHNLKQKLHIDFFWLKNTAQLQGEGRYSDNTVRETARR